MPRKPSLAPNSRIKIRGLCAIASATRESPSVDVSPLMIDPNSGQAHQTSVYVNVTPVSARVPVEQHKQFIATVVGNSNPAVAWDVKGVIGGNASVGFIDSISGRYTAPLVVPSPATVTIHATSIAVPSATGSATVTITPPPPAVSITISPLSATVRVGHTQRFTANVKNTTNTMVTWKVNGVMGGNGTVGTIGATGLYTAPFAVPSPSNVSVTAVSAADSTKSVSATVVVGRVPSGIQR